MTIESFFKPRINWKIFNAILDACTELDDIDESYRIEVCLFNEEMQHSELQMYLPIFFHNPIGDDGYTTDSFYLDKYEKSFVKYGLYYVLTTYTDHEQIAVKIASNKQIERLTNRHTAKVKRYTFKSI